MWSDLLFRLRALRRRPEMDRELDEELRFHMEHQVELYRKQGLTEREARVAFGGISQVKEESRDAWGVGAVSALGRDLRYGLRGLKRSSGFAVVAVVSLALGIGANTAVFQVVNALRLRVLPVSRPEELAQVYPASLNGARGSINIERGVTYPIWAEIRKRQEGFTGVFAWSEGMRNLSATGEVRMARNLWVTGDFFSTLGVRAAKGRLLGPSDDYRGCGLPGAVISDAFWRSEFSGDPGAVGRKLTVDGRAVEVIGITAPEFFGMEVGKDFQIALPVCSYSAIRGWEPMDSGTYWWLNVVGRLRPGWSAERAAAHVRAISRGVFEASLPAKYPAASVADYRAMQLTAARASTGLSNVRERYSSALLILLAVAGLVMLIACANLANLMLARASTRQREIAVRLAIGASRGGLIRQLMTESLLLAGMGAAVGLAAAAPASRLLVAMLSAGETAVRVDVGTDWRVLGFAAGLCGLTCVLFGLGPALRATRNGPGAALQAAGRGIASERDSFGVRRVLAVAQIALSLVLLSGSLLLTGSLRKLLQVETGFDARGVVIADLSYVRTHPEKVKLPEMQKALLARVRSVPGVVAAADTLNVPLGGSSSSNAVWMDGASAAGATNSLRSRVSPEYFRTLKIPLVAGRDFDDRDVKGAPLVAMVNQAWARKYVGPANPVGMRFHVEPTPSTPELVYEIVGLVGNTKYRELREEFEPVYYLALFQDPAPQLVDQLVIRTAGHAPAVLAELRRALEQADADARYRIDDYQQGIEETLLPERLLAKVSAAFGLLAGLLAAAGLYGLLSYLVARMRNEIGVRMALGADREAIARMVLAKSAGLLAAGTAVGLAMSVGAATMAGRLLYGVRPWDPGTLAGSAGLLAGVALVASWAPARRAASVDPGVALRGE